jgi:RNA polymerase sigma-70 factor, ECF subfamily
LWRPSSTASIVLRWTVSPVGASGNAAALLPLSNTLEVASIFREYGRFVHHALRRLGVRASDVDDACQEVFVVIHRRLDNFEQRSSLRAWVYGICVRVAAAQRRRRYVGREIASDSVPEAIDPMTPAENLSVREARETLDAILSNLDDEKRAAFVLYELEELTIVEVAQALNCRPQTAYSRLCAARELVEAAVRRHRLKGAFE